MAPNAAPSSFYPFGSRRTAAYSRALPRHAGYCHHNSLRSRVRKRGHHWCEKGGITHSGCETGGITDSGIWAGGPVRCRCGKGALLISGSGPAGPARYRCEKGGITDSGCEKGGITDSGCEKGGITDSGIWAGGPVRCRCGKGGITYFGIWAGRARESIRPSPTAEPGFPPSSGRLADGRAARTGAAGRSGRGRRPRAATNRRLAGETFVRPRTGRLGFAERGQFKPAVKFSPARQPSRPP